MLIIMSWAEGNIFYIIIIPFQNKIFLKNMATNFSTKWYFKCDLQSLQSLLQMKYHEVVDR